MLYTAHDLGQWFRHTEYMAGVMASRPQPHPVLVAHLGQCISAFIAASTMYLREVPGAGDVDIMIRRSRALMVNFNLTEAGGGGKMDLNCESYSTANSPMVTFRELEKWKHHLVHMLGHIASLEAMNSMQGAQQTAQHLRAYLASSAQMLAREVEAFVLPSPACPMRLHDLRVIHGQAMSVFRSSKAGPRPRPLNTHV